MRYRTTYSLAIILFSIFVLSSVDTQAQYSKFSDQTMTPSLYNSAYAGVERHRLNLSSKYKRVLSGQEPYTAVVGSINTSLIRGFKKSHWLGIAIDYYRDANRFRTHNAQEVSFNLAYHIPLGKKDKTQLSIGLMVGNNKLKTSKSYLDRLLRNSNIVVNGPALTENSKVFDPQISGIGGLGFLLKSQLSEKSNVDLSLSIDTENEPYNWSRINLNPGGIIDCQIERSHPFCGQGEQIFLPEINNNTTRVTALIEYKYKMSSRLSVMPRIVLFNFDNGFFSQEINMQYQFFIDYELSDLALTSGIGYSSLHHPLYQLFMGVRTNHLRFTIAYDTDFSGRWRPSLYSGALELSIGYSFYLKSETSMVSEIRL